jgi:hypothetical protein
VLYNAPYITKWKKCKDKERNQFQAFGKLNMKKGLTPLQDGRKRGDMVELHKMQNIFTKVQKDQLFEMKDDVQMIRGNVYLNLFKHSHLDIRKNFFTERVIVSNVMDVY